MNSSTKPLFKTIRLRLNQASQEMQMVQQLLVYLQNRGIIQINNQGQITVIGGYGD